MASVFPQPLPLYLATFIVIARDDRQPDGTPGHFTLATRQVFSSEAEAVEYAEGISPSREPLVVSGRFDRLCF